MEVLVVLTVIFGLASAAPAAPVIPWADNVTFTSGTAAVGVEPNTSAANTDWGPAISFNLTNNSSFTSVAYTPGTSGSNGTPAYVSNAITSNIGAFYPGGSTLSPSGASPSNVTEVGPFFVASSVTAISSSSGSLIYTDPYNFGTKLSVAASSNPIYQPSSDFFNPGSDAAILAGNFVSTSNGSVGTIVMKWRTRSQTEMDKSAGTANILPTNAKYLASDVMQLSGQKPGYDYVLQMDFSNQVEVPTDQFNDILAGRALFLGELNGAGNGSASWVNAVHNNVPSTDGLSAVGAYAWQPNDGTSQSNKWVSGTTVSGQPFLGSFEDFLDSTYVAQDGTVHHFYEHPLDQLRGTWGVDLSTDTAWAVLDNGGGIFAVVPEPGSIGLLVVGMVCLAFGVWRRRR
jgi:hypothetical protein